MDVISINGPSKWRTPDGQIWEVSPGPRGRGLLVVQGVPLSVVAQDMPRGKRGRRPNALTIRFRETLQSHLRRDQVLGPTEYFDWLMENGAKSQASARQLVYKELKTAGIKLRRGKRRQARKAPPGRRASKPTTILREQLAKDRVADGLQETTHYVRWLVDRAGIGLKRARSIVYRELRVARTGVNYT